VKFRVILTTEYPHWPYVSESTFSIVCDVTNTGHVWVRIFLIPGRLLSSQERDASLKLKGKATRQTSQHSWPAVTA